MKPLVHPEFERLCRDLMRRPRPCGYYLLRLVQRTPTAQPFDEGELDRLFEALDDQPWPAREQRELLAPGQLWAEYEIEESAARQSVLDALEGGPRIGHIEATVPPAEALGHWQRFRGLFSAQAKFYAGLGFGDREYVFSNGVVAVDPDRAGTLLIVESD